MVQVIKWNHYVSKEIQLYYITISCFSDFDEYLVLYETHLVAIFFGSITIIQNICSLNLRNVTSNDRFLTIRRSSVFYSKTFVKNWCFSRLTSNLWVYSKWLKSSSRTDRKAMRFSLDRLDSIDWEINRNIESGRFSLLAKITNPQSIVQSISVRLLVLGSEFAFIFN